MQSNLQTDLLGQTVFISDHSGKVRGIYTNENGNLRFIVEEKGLLIVRMIGEFRVTGSGL